LLFLGEGLVAFFVKLHADAVRPFSGNDLLHKVHRFLGNMGRADQDDLALLELDDMNVGGTVRSQGG
jgi:hypothetical protein